LKPKGSDYPDEIKTIGDLIRRRRIDLGLSQTQAGLRLGVHYVTVGDWERGRKTPTAANILAIKEFLRFGRTELLSPISLYADVAMAIVT
jgi:transcriptional regulator with XRE-family HTH domain